MVDIPALFKRPTFLLKFVEMLLAAICTALVAGDIPVGYDLNKIAVIYVTIIGYMMIGIVVILAYFLDTPLQRFLLVAIAASGFIMFITAGSLMCEFYSDHNSDSFSLGRLLGSGIIALINCIVYAIDAVLTFLENTE